MIGRFLFLTMFGIANLHLGVFEDLAEVKRKTAYALQSTTIKSYIDNLFDPSLANIALRHTRTCSLVHVLPP